MTPRRTSGSRPDAPMTPKIRVARTPKQENLQRSTASAQFLWFQAVKTDHLFYGDESVWAARGLLFECRRPAAFVEECQYRFAYN